MSASAVSNGFEERLKAVEDRLAIYQLLAAYGPAVDSLCEDAVAALWTGDGVYDAGGKAPYRGSAAIGDLVNQEPHRSYVGAGCAHVVSLPHVAIDGDTAVATGHSRVYLKQGDHWRVERASANRWDLVRTPDGWRVAHRLNRPLDGTAGPRAVLAGAFAAPGGAEREPTA